MKKGKIFKKLNEAYSHFGKILHNNDLLMIKGSNATGLNQFSKNINATHGKSICCRLLHSTLKRIFVT